MKTFLRFVPLLLSLVSCQSSSPIVTLSDDDSFNYKLLVTMAQATYGGADINDVLSTAIKVKPSNFSSWNETFFHLAVDTEAKADRQTNALNARDTYFAAANYWRNVDYYLHGDPEDPWINQTWVYQKRNFDKALAQLPFPGERLVLPSTGFDTYAIFYSTNTTQEKRPTIILGNGYDGSQEDIFFALGQSGLDRGYNVITYEGPGQPSVRRNQSAGFIKDWNRALTPVIDYLHNRSDVDTSRVALVGFSFGGFLAEQAAAVEKDRLAALILDPGVYDVYDAFTSQLPQQLNTLYQSGNRSAFDDAVNSALANSSTPTQLRWGVEQGLWSFNIDSPYEFLQHVKDWNIKNITDKLTMPIWIATGDQEQFYTGQAVEVYNAVRKHNQNVTLTNYTGSEGFHCQAGAYETLSRDMYGWLDGLFA